MNEPNTTQARRRSPRLVKTSSETKDKQAKKATGETKKKQQAAAEARKVEPKKATVKKKTSLKRERETSTNPTDPETLRTTGEEPATSSNNAESSTSAITTTQDVADPPAPAGRQKKKRTMSNKAATAAALTVPIPEDLKAGELANLMEMQARLRRAVSQRMYVINRERENDHTEIFEVLGSIGNLYKVTIGPKLECSCRDFRYRRIHCKHIFLVLARVFHLTGESPAYQSLTLSPDELDLIFSSCTPDPNVLATKQIQEAINNKKDGKPVDISKRRPLKDADCPICYEELDESSIALTVFCNTCGNNVHKSCFTQWSNSLKSRYQTVTCVFCRCEWHTSHPVQLKKNNEGYINFQEEAGLPTRRDTSTYGQP